MTYWFFIGSICQSVYWLAEMEFKYHWIPQVYQFFAGLYTYVTRSGVDVQTYVVAW